MTKRAQVRAVLPGIELLMAILGVSDPPPKPRVGGESR
jgi:hypothetical protein